MTLKSYEAAIKAAGGTLTSSTKRWLDKAKKDRDGPLVRNLIQIYAKRYTISNKVALLQLATGMGKTKIAADVVNEVGGLWLVVYFQSTHKKNLIDDFTKWYGKDILSHLTFTTYASLHKQADKSYDGIIMDEAHHITERSQPFIASIKATYRLYLSAKVPSDKKELLKACDKRTFHVFPVSLKQTITWGILPDTKYLLLPVYPRSGAPDYHYEFRCRKGDPKKIMSFARFAPLKFKPHNIIVPCNEAQRCVMYDLEIASWNGTVQHLFKIGKYNAAKIVRERQMSPLGLKRKLFHTGIKMREVFTEELLDLLKKFRCVIFGDRILDIEKLPFEAIHSERKDNDAIIDAFNKGLISGLSAVNMLNESMNLKDIECGVILSLTKKTDVANIQRQGRLVRGKEPFVIVPYVANTKDEDFVTRYFADYTTKHFSTIENLITYVEEQYENQPPH